MIKGFLLFRSCMMYCTMVFHQSQDECDVNFSYDNNFVISIPNAPSVSTLLRFRFYSNKNYFCLYHVVIDGIRLSYLYVNLLYNIFVFDFEWTLNLMWRERGGKGEGRRGREREEEGEGGRESERWLLAFSILRLSHNQSYSYSIVVKYMIF